MKNKTNIIFVFVILALFIYWNILRAMNYTYKITRVNFQKIGLNSTVGAVEIQITNNSFFSAEIESFDLTLLINGVKITKLEGESILISSNSVFTVPFSFAFSPNKILSIKNFFALNGIANPDKTTLSIYGYINVKKGFVKSKVPVMFNAPISYYL